MEATSKKTSLEKEVGDTGTLPDDEVDYISSAQEKEAADDDGAGARIRVERPHEDSQVAMDTLSEKGDTEKGATDMAGSDPRHLSVDRGRDTRRKRESVESRFSSAFRDSSVLSSDDDEDEITLADRLASPEADRPQYSRGNTTIRSASSHRSMPPLRRRETKLAQKEAHPWQHLGITLGLPAILLFDLIVPCIVYYIWYNKQTGLWKETCRTNHPNQPCPTPKPEYNSHILGYAILCFGFGELWILLARIWRLVFRREDCAPLLSRSAWDLDATSWVYGVAMILALIPFVIGAERQIPTLYLYSPSFIMGFLGILMLITTLCPFTLPVGINSQPRGSKLRPFIYYAAEDFIAVDGLQDREFRVRYNDRYETNKMFRQFFLCLTMWWILGVLVYIGSVSAIIFTLEFHYAFGLSLGVLFSYISIWAVVTAIW